MLIYHKDYLCGEFKSWYAKQVCREFKAECEKAPIDLHHSEVKPIGAEWIKVCTATLKVLLVMVLMVLKVYRTTI